MFACPHCSQNTISALRVLATPARLRCPQCAGLSQTTLGPHSFIGQAIYLLACMTVGVALAWTAYKPPALFWSAVVLTLLVLVSYQLVIASKHPLEPIHKVHFSVASTLAWLRSGAFFRALGWLAGLLALGAGYIVAFWSWAGVVVG